jgi:hypothetical protein
VGTGPGLLLLHDHGEHGLHAHAGAGALPMSSMLSDARLAHAHESSNEHASPPRSDRVRHGGLSRAPSGTADADAATSTDHAPGVLVEWPSWVTVDRPAWAACLQSMAMRCVAEPQSFGSFAPDVIRLNFHRRPPDDAEPSQVKGSVTVRILRTSHALLI